MAVTRTKVRIGVFIPSKVQLLDLACVDFFAMLSFDYLVPNHPASLTDLAPEVSIAYIGTAASVPMTAQTGILTTHLISDPAVAPGELDIVLVPGPDPASTWDEEVKGWLRRHGEAKGTDVLCVCTGIFLVGEAGLLTGKTVCGPRNLQDMIRARYDVVKAVGETYRWVRDGNLWTSGESHVVLCSEEIRPRGDWVRNVSEEWAN